MLEISPELVEKIKGINGLFRSVYSHSTDEKKIIRQKLKESGAIIRQIQRFSTKYLSNWLIGREVAAVDGSVNQTKGDAPHLLYLFQGLAKTTSGVECLTTDIYAPLIDEKRSEEEGVNWRAHILAKLELEAAYQLLEKRDIALLLMDGALYHYRIDAPDEWERLRKKALDQQVLLVGVSEEITTENLVQLDSFANYRKRPKAYDRDLLFGVLAQEEMLYIEQIQHKAGLQSVWMRLSTDPAITGFDLLEEQAHMKNEVASLLLTLTPQHGRGIPLWLDYVDREVRVTDKLVEALVEQYIDSEIRQRFFVKKRHGRPY
ncbi:DNA double-strand break repair nuclease NurA [Halalkalibacter nanhaiisediminis]|uniref:NurA domain-containing protein n=1 Tax=Halalkalibacter nanhaiisediminis TaxID=688079 RepID=A0A562Q975_9BACI|nr:DNA double-strand break repair nuclease NurA [Halalkalibacter nanhaiisediminis]TWI53244.1 NurA domain-containing protein [Halalkalibacter nanhaiisediminis]